MDAKNALTIKNIGDGSVFIERIDVVVEKTGVGAAFRTTTSIEKVLEKNQIVSFAIGDEIEHAGDVLFRNNEFNPDDKALATLLKGADPNIQRLILNKDNGKLINYKSIAREKAITYNAEATIYFLSLFKDSPSTVKFDCEVVFVKLKGITNKANAADAKRRTAD